MRVVQVRTGVVLDQHGGALAKMLPPFRLGVGGPVAGGRQYLPWIHVDDLVGIYLAALDDAALGGAGQRDARPSPSTNREFSRALGRALHRPARRARARPRAARCSTARWRRSSPRASARCPRAPLELGYEFRHTDLDEALRDALG